MVVDNKSRRSPSRASPDYLQKKRGASESAPRASPVRTSPAFQKQEPELDIIGTKVVIHAAPEGENLFDKETVNELRLLFNKTLPKKGGEYLNQKSVLKCLSDLAGVDTKPSAIVKCLESYGFKLVDKYNFHEFLSFLQKVTESDAFKNGLGGANSVTSEPTDGTNISATHGTSNSSASAAPETKQYVQSKSAAPEKSASPTVKEMSHRWNRDALHALCQKTLGMVDQLNSQLHSSALDRVSLMEVHHQYRLQDVKNELSSMSADSKSLESIPVRSRACRMLLSSFIFYLNRIETFSKFNLRKLLKLFF